MSGLTLEDIATLVDGKGNIPDETAERLAPLIAADPRFTGARARLERMAEDVGVELMADALFVFRCLEKLRQQTWRRPTEVLDPRVEVPYAELIAMAGAMAARAGGEAAVELTELEQRLRLALADASGPAAPGKGVG